MTQTSTHTPRLHAVDALRGFALVGVGIVHFVEQYIAGIPPQAVTEVAMATLPDKIVVGLIQFLLAGKFYAIFSFLFGLSFFIQIDKPKTAGEPFIGRFTWRLILLLGFGYIHHLFYRGDILMLYSVLGFFLILVHTLPTRFLFIAALALFFGLGRFISFALFSEAFKMDMDAESATNIAYFDTLQNGSLLDVFAINNILGIQNLVQFQFGIFGRGYNTLGLFLLGMCVGRLGIFHNLTELKPKIKKTLWISIATTVVFIAMMAGAFIQVGEPSFTTWLEALALTFYDLANLSLACAITCGFLLFGSRLKSTKTFPIFAPYGRMALTNYIFQSIIGTAILFGWGLGVIGSWPNRYLLLLGLVVICCQMVFSAYWMKRFYYGPLEWLWRSLTLRRKVTLRKPIQE